MKRVSAWRLLRTATPRRALLIGLLPAAAAELSGAALLGVSGWFLTTCAVVTLQANTTWSWMYPSGAVRTLALTRTGLRYVERLVNHRALLASQVALRARLARGVGLIAAVVVLCAALGTLLARLTGATPLEGYLATTPGGVYAVLATAVSSGVDVAFVVAVQVLRVVVMLLVAPAIARLVARRRT